MLMMIANNPSSKYKTLNHPLGLSGFEKVLPNAIITYPLQIYISRAKSVL